jgi:hypothetical protein
MVAQRWRRFDTLSSMTDLVLLGAGGSVDAGLPTSFGLTRELSKASALPESGRRGGATELATALAFAIGTLYQQRGSAGVNPMQKPEVDIEELVDAIDSLAHPELSGMTPFVSGWHPFLRDIDAAHDDRNQMIENFVNGLERALNAASEREAASAREGAQAALRLALLLAQPKFASVLFRRLKTSILLRTSQILWLKDDEAVARTSYLAPLVSSPSTRCIATLNYDNAIEACAQALGIRLSVGLEGYGAHGVVSFPADAQIRLLKLHGALDWQFPDSVEERRDYPGKSALRFSWQRVTPVDPKWDPDCLGIVFGRQKLQTPGPFLDLLHCFANELATVDRLITIGYAFRDDHINRLIVQFLMRRSTAKLLVVDPVLPENYVVLVDLLKRFSGRIRIRNITAAAALSTYPMPVE